jgi:hypothetical protein
VTGGGRPKALRRGNTALHHTFCRLRLAVSHARRIKAACPEAALWRIEGNEHVGAYAHPKYRQRILGFLRTEVFAQET